MKPCTNCQKLCQNLVRCRGTASHRHHRTFSSKTFPQKRCQQIQTSETGCTQILCRFLHQSCLPDSWWLASSQSCLPDSWWLASSIDQNYLQGPPRPTKESMTSQQIETDSYHILSYHMTSDDIIYILSYWNRFRWYIFSHQKFRRTRSTQEPCRNLPETPQLLFQSSQSTRGKIAEAIDHRGHRSRYCRPDPAASQHASETNENLCRTFQTWISQHASETNQNLCRTFQTWMTQHASETNESLCKTQTWISQHASETNQNLRRTSQTWMTQHASETNENLRRTFQT